MSTEILMPALSPTMEEGKLAKWLVKEGDAVTSGDLVAEIETDKATMEFEAVDEGVIGRLLVAEGTEGVKVNTAIALLLEDGETTADMPAAGQDATVKEAAPARGSDASVLPVTTTAPSPSPARTDGQRIFASPLARRIAAEKGLDLSQISGSGPHGRIVKADLMTISRADQSTAPAVAKTAPPAPAPAQTSTAKTPQGMSADTVRKMYQDRAFEEIALDGMRKTIAARLSEAKQTIPHFYLRRDIRLDPLLALRKDLNEKLGGRNVKLSVNDFIIKACALALQQHPDANAVWAEDRILRLSPSDVAVAVAIDGGLFTPVLRDSETKSLSALSGEMKDLAARARDRKLAPHEYQGGSFAISNLGMFGIDNFDAVINPPHAAILAVGAGSPKPVVTANGELGVATVMSVTLSVDHRVIDGALGAQLLEAIVDNLESPLLMLA